MREFEIIKKCEEIFSNLGWEVRVGGSLELGRPNHNPFNFDIELYYNGETYGFVEVIRSENIEEKAKIIQVLMDEVVKKTKPRIFVITNGFAFDVYHGEDFYGTLTVPPAPEFVDILLGGE